MTDFWYVRSDKNTFASQKSAENVILGNLRVEIDQKCNAHTHQNICPASHTNMQSSRLVSWKPFDCQPDQILCKTELCKTVCNMQLMVTLMVMVKLCVKLQLMVTRQPGPALEWTSQAASQSGGPAPRNLAPSPGRLYGVRQGLWGFRNPLWRNFENIVLFYSKK